MSYPLRSKEKPHILALRMAELKYRGRAITEDHLLYVRQLIADHPQASRRTLSKKLCEAWQWRQANGALSDMVCRSLLVLLERARRDPAPAREVHSAQSTGQKSATQTTVDR